MTTTNSIPWLAVAICVFWVAACEQKPDSYDYHGQPADLAGLDVSGTTDITLDLQYPPDEVPEPDAAPAELPRPSDSVSDEASPPDLVFEDEAAPADTSEPPVGCGDIEFQYDAGTQAGVVFLSGSFNNWGDSPASGTPMDDDDGDGIWTVVVHLEPGKYTYKFVVDGEWLLDPANPNQEDDGNGNVNSVLYVEECGGPGALYLKSHHTDQAAKTFTAVFATDGEDPIDESQLEITLDWDPVDNNALSVSGDGKELEIALEGLSTGIHDVRVATGDDIFLLKVYIDISTDWRDAILYFVMTDRFEDGDPGNNQPVADAEWRTNYQGGDFAGVTKRINEGYFDDLGVGAIWLSWPVDNPDFSHPGGYPAEHYCGMNPKTAQYAGTTYTGYHGYWPSKLYQTDEHFGSMDELKGLVNAAHAHGIRILLDFTANHVHDSSPFYQDHSDDNFFHFPAEICQDVGWDNKPVTCWFVDYLPDLNYSNPSAVSEVLDYAVWWVKQSGCDGFRLDAVKHIEFEFIYQLRARVKKELELTGVDFYIVGETFTGDAGLIKSFIGPDKIHGQFDFPANMSILQGFATQETGLGVMDEAVRSAKGVYGNGALMSNFIGNHDIARFISQASGMIDCGIWDVVSNIAQGWHSPPEAPSDEVPYRKLQLAFTYIMTIPGIPLIYYGDEFGLPGAGDPDNRRMMRFDNELGAHEKSTLAFLKKLGQVRGSHLSLSRGDWSAPLWSEGGFLAYARTLPDEKAVILLNLGTGAKAGKLDVGSAGIADGAQLEDGLGGSQETVAGGKLQFNVPARSAAIFITK